MQRLLYVGVILVAIVQVLSGLAIWKPVQFQELTALFFGFQGARLAHFIGMTVDRSASSSFTSRWRCWCRARCVSMVTGGPEVDPATGAAPQPTPARITTTAS